ncbi:hypothetical protein [Methylobacterium oryzihabitans]|uniref:Uncharacterized protein n=1 Tax=Methylobacterium oryzihabitans TaxID=2499852 RepID=A0A437P890_9HYPH|nr:hypothetical protein [Methylobacterium oryzihabitans]RVU18461.1 hypothetical protein EOE48_11270 [Methylobacterium oryzihabitans]
MGEYVMTTVTIGGAMVGPGAVTALVAAASVYFAEADTLVRDALANGTSLTFEDAQDYGLTPGLDAFCRNHGLSYHRAWIARPGVFDAGVKFWQPGMASPVEESADDGGKPMITLAALRNCHEAGETLSDVMARLEKAEASAVPPLTLVVAAGAARQVTA